MRFGRVRARGIALGVLLLALTMTLLWSAVALAKPGATITGEFGDSCRDFSAHSSKAISHVEIHYADGRVVKDETVASRDYAIDGGPGDEIDSVDVKSGTTTETFTCTARTNSPPTAVLELQTPPDCILFDPPNDHWSCNGERASDRTSWLSAAGVSWSCPFLERPCETTYRLRGTSSSDPDNDIASWSIEFEDCVDAPDVPQCSVGGNLVASESGDWATQPPTGVDHASQRFGRVVTLTVTDSAGQSDSDRMAVYFSGTFD